MHIYHDNTWAAILASASSLCTQSKLTPEFWIDQQLGEKWKEFVPMGRGHGSYPKPPFKEFRGGHYKYNPYAAGHRHMKLFTEKKVNNCQRCGRSLGHFEVTPLDYLTFYKTGQLFTWMDPAWVSGNIPFDPRQHDQPEESPFMARWLCNICWAKMEELAYSRHKSNNYRWEYYSKSFMFIGDKRVLRDRRLWGHIVPFAAKDGVPDRRHSIGRRAGDLEAYKDAFMVESTDKPGVFIDPELGEGIEIVAFGRSSHEVPVCYREALIDRVTLYDSDVVMPI